MRDHTLTAIVVGGLLVFAALALLLAGQADAAPGDGWEFVRPPKQTKPVDERGG